jgi:tetratricopeptide (TPR) repeat protein
VGNKQAAIAEMEALARQYPNDLNYRGMLADMLLRNDEELQALKLYKEILAEEPDNTRAQISLRSYYRVQGETEKVDSMTEQVLLNKNTTTEQRIYLMRQMVSDSERDGGDSTKVLEMFHKMLAQPQQNADIATLCAAYMDLKKMPRDSVQDMLQMVLRIAPDNAAARLQLVSYAWDRKDQDEVISLCQDARQYNPEEMAFYYYQGMAYYQKDNREKALEAFQNGIGVINEESNPAIVSDFYAVMGDLLHQKGMTREAYEAYDSCLQWKDDNVMCLNNYAYFLSENGEQLEKAESMSYKTVKAEPKNATYLDTYAWILFMQKRYAEAKIYIEQALQNDSDGNAVITEHAGDIYVQNNDPERAVELWQQALKKDPKNKILIRKIKQKKYLKK